MKAFQAGRSGETLAWASFEGGIGGNSENPGIAFGTGTGARDTNIYRGGANILETDDAFRADTLAVSGTLATTQANLGIVAPYSFVGIGPSTTISASEIYGAGGWSASAIVGITETLATRGGHDDSPVYSGFAAGIYKFTMKKSTADLGFCISKATTAPVTAAEVVAAASMQYDSGTTFEGNLAVVADIQFVEVAANEHVWVYNCGGAQQNQSATVAIERVGG